MTTDINVIITDKNKITIDEDGDDSTLTIQGKVDLWSYEKARGNNTNGLRPTLPTADGDVQKTSIGSIEIKGSEEKLEVIKNLILLKGELKEVKTEGKDWAFQIIGINKNLMVGTEHWELDGAILKLSADDFSGSVDESIVNISVVDLNTKTSDGSYTGKGTLANEKAALLETEKLLEDLETEFKNPVIEKGKDADLRDVGEIFGKKNTATEEGSGLLSYLVGNEFNQAYPKNSDSINQIIFDLADKDDVRPYYSRIRNWITFVWKVDFWFKRGITKKKDIVKIGIAGFDLGADLNELEKDTSGATYKGFPIVDPNLEIDEGATDTDDMVPKTDSQVDDRYTKEAIDNFRQAGLNVFKDVNISDPKKLYGFQPGDLDDSGQAAGGHTPEENNAYFTKWQVEIMEMGKGTTTLDQLIDKAFYQTHFDEVEFPCKVLKTKADGSGSEEKNLANELDLLDFYLGKDYQGSGVWYHGTAGQDGKTKFNINDNSEAGHVKIIQNYDIIKTFLELYIKTYTDKGTWETDKAKLKGYENGSVEEKKIWAFWKDKINNKITQNDAIFNPAPGAKWDTRDADVKTETEKPDIKDSEEAKNIFDALTVNDKKLFDKLKVLVPAVLKAKKVKDDTKFADMKATLTTLKGFKDKKDTTDEGKAWNFANQERKGKGKNLALNAYNDLETKVNKALNDAIDEAKGKIKPDDVYNKIVGNNADINEDADKIKAAVKIFEKATTAWTTSKSDQNLQNELSGFQTSDPDAWAAVNKHEKDGKKYADEALEKIKKINEGAGKKFGDVVKNSANVGEYDEDIKDVENDIGDNDKADFTEIYKPIGRKAVEVRTKSGGATAKEKELADLITTDVLGIANETDKSKLERLKTGIEKFKNSQSGDEKNAWNSFASVHDKIEKLITKISNRLSQLKDDNEDNNENPNNTDKPPFWKTPLGIFTILGSVLVVVAIVAYLIKTNTNEEGEGE